MQWLFILIFEGCFGASYSLPRKKLAEKGTPMSNWRKRDRKRLENRSQFHQPFTHGFFVRKFCAKLFCTYILGLKFFGARILALCAHKMLVKLTTIGWWWIQKKLSRMIGQWQRQQRRIEEPRSPGPNYD